MTIDWELLALFYFSMASVGFMLFLVKYRRRPDVKLWGIRACHVFGFLGVLCLRVAKGYFTEPALLITSSLIVSLVAFEISSRFLKTG